MVRICLYGISGVCLWILLSAIIVNFVLSKKAVVRKEKKSVVETGSMFGFFVAMVLLVYRHIGQWEMSAESELTAAFIGTILIIAGTAINIAGRLKLRGNWGNQIKIYENHTLTTTGIYRYIRHPLYSSTILMLYGFSFLFFNWLVFLLNSILFLPFMVYRSNQEEQLLAVVFKEDFIRYKAETGLFIPKMRR